MKILLLLSLLFYPISYGLESDVKVLQVCKMRKNKDGNLELNVLKNLTQNQMFLSQAKMVRRLPEHEKFRLKNFKNVGRYYVVYLFRNDQGGTKVSSAIIESHKGKKGFFYSDFHDKRTFHIWSRLDDVDK